jgi:hypothetical protein
MTGANFLAARPINIDGKRQLILAARPINIDGRR